MKPEPYRASTKKETSNDEKNQRKVSKTYKSGGQKHTVRQRS